MNNRNATSNSATATAMIHSRRLPFRTDDVLRRSLLRALARDLSLPQDHFAVTATMQALAGVSLRQQTLVVEGEPVETVPEQLVDVSLDTWCCVVAHAAADADASTRDTAA